MAKIVEPKTVTINVAYKKHVDSAQKRGFIPLPKEIWLSLSSKECWYCGKIDTRNVAISSYRKRKMNLTDEQISSYSVNLNGIDRADNSIGYSRDNVLPCCRACNRMKNAFSQKDFILKIIKINKKHGRQN